MVLVNDIWQECKKIVGNSDDNFLFKRIGDAVELLANKGDFDPLLGTLDICVSGKVVTLPPEVETILGLNMNKNPALGRDELFQFHINGPGQCGRPIRYEYMDLGDACTYRELGCPFQLHAYCVAEEDVDTELRVFGYDQGQNWIRTKMPDGTYVDGYLVPVTLQNGTHDEDAPFFSRITKISKELTEGPVKLVSVDEDEEVLLGVYQPYETIPRYRRIQLSHCVSQVRIKFRRRTVTPRSRFDLLPLHSNQAVIMMLRAMKAYDTPGGFADGEAFEATATRWLSEEQFTRNPPVAHPLQVTDAGAISDCDQLD